MPCMTPPAFACAASLSAKSVFLPRSNSTAYNGGKRMFIARLAALTLLASGWAWTQPTCNQCAATYIPATELEAYLNAAKTGSATNIRLRDQQVRAVDAGRTQIGVGIVYRTKLDKPADQSVAEH